MGQPFSVADVSSLIESLDGDYNDGINAFVGATIDEIGLTDPATGITQRFRITIEEIS